MAKTITTLQTTLLLRRAVFEDTCVLALGEPGYHTGTKELKIGDGSTIWKDLPIANKAQIDALIAAGVADAKDYADGKVASVDKKAGTAITVDNADPKNPKVGLALANAGNVELSQTDDGLSAAIDLSAYKTDSANEAKYKQLQTAITAADTDPNVFVYGADQNENGEITVKTKAVDFSNYYTKEETDGIVHDHADGTGTVVGSTADGDVAINLNLEFAKLGEDKKLKLVDKTSKAVVAEFEASEFIKDGMLHNVEYDANTNKLTFTWNTDAGDKTDEVTLSDILDPYVFTEGAKIDITVDGTKVTIAHETVAAPTETAGTGRKYLTGVTTDGYGHITGFTTASETDQDLSGYKTKQDAYSKEGSVKQTITKVTQNENGEVDVVYGDIDFSHDHDEQYKKLQDEVSFGSAAKNTFIQTISQDENGVITATTGIADVGVTKVSAGTDIVVTPETGTGEVTVAHATYETGTIKDATHDSLENPSFITGIKIQNGHVTGATVQNLKAVLENMIFVLDGGEEAGTLVIG